MSRIRSFVLAAMAAATIAVPANAETLRWAGRADLYSLDPYSVPSTSNLAFLNHVYEGLVRYGPDFQIEPALAAGANHLLLDNMDPAALREAVTLVAGRAATEASGGVRLDTIAAIAASGVDYVSVGRLTQSAPAADIGLDFTPL